MLCIIFFGVEAAPTMVDRPNTTTGTVQAGDWRNTSQLEGLQQIAPRNIPLAAKKKTVKITRHILTHQMEQ